MENPASPLCLSKSGKSRLLHFPPLLEEGANENNSRQGEATSCGACRLLFAVRYSPLGFTLLELILATAISAFVIGILAVCFSFALRAWLSVQDQRPDETFQLADLLKRQLSECLPTPMRFTDSTVHSLFAGQPNSIAFVTTHSVKALSQGVPVVAHYTYDPNSRVLSSRNSCWIPITRHSSRSFLPARLLPVKRLKFVPTVLLFRNSC